VILSRRKICVGMWKEWGRGISWFLVVKREGKNNLKDLDVGERIIYNGYAKNVPILDWDDLSLDGDLCQAFL
jgi:hypothetical protein